MSGLTKIISPQILAQHVSGLLFLSAPYAVLVAIALSVVELGGGILLLANRLVVQASLVLMLMTLGFTFWQVWLLLQVSTNVECGCFGSFIPETIGWKTVTRNILILLATMSIGSQTMGSGSKNSLDKYQA